MTLPPAVVTVGGKVLKKIFSERKDNRITNKTAYSIMGLLRSFNRSIAIFFVQYINIVV